MKYFICLAKNDTARNEKAPVYNPDNWEIKEVVKCRKNASKENFEKVFCKKYDWAKDFAIGSYRTWHFMESEVV